ncbi:hypothetical protein DY000_02042369 [Brassica cretica]|uniref:F-box domain-containing protein n=1 Tax=Brassica cretica TaxID=69181 RepID=A0ABQ7BFN0_BRACR|nr:hypothetical protein DY000_02042369 [Brassica cretica]
MTMMSDLPWDLVEVILGRVPAISLKRLRSSCKRWNRLFNDKEFARKHFHKAPKQSFVNGEKGIQNLMSLNSHGTPSLEFKDTRIMLWNPCTGETRWIQQMKGSYP